MCLKLVLWLQVYIPEVSPPRLRGLLGTAQECLVVGGITLNYALGSINGFLYHHISLVAVGIVALFAWSGCQRLQGPYSLEGTPMRQRELCSS